MSCVVISLYDLGRVPIEARAVASALQATVLDLSNAPVPASMGGNDTIIVVVGMHTAARLAQQLLPELRVKAPLARVAATGLYAQMVELDVDASFGPEDLAALVDWAQTGEPGQAATVPAAIELSAAAKYRSADGVEHLAGAVAASRGCLHRCRHCPVPVAYDGRIHLNAVEGVLASIDEQVRHGATHVSFADPDFLNAPAHAQRVIAAVHERHPKLTWDATVKVEHVVRHRDRFVGFAASGCTFVISAFESVDDNTLRELDKGHTAADEITALAILRGVGIEVRPSWMAFTPWTTIDHVVELFRFVADNDLVASIDPVQYGIRLLVPKGSLIADRLESQGRLGSYDRSALAYPWRSIDPVLDELAVTLADIADASTAGGEPDHVAFNRLRRAVHTAAGLPDPAPTGPVAARPRMTEAWFCCAEPMSRSHEPVSCASTTVGSRSGPFAIPTASSERNDDCCAAPIA